MLASCSRTSRERRRGCAAGSRGRSSRSADAPVEPEGSVPDLRGVRHQVRHPTSVSSAAALFVRAQILQYERIHEFGDVAYDVVPACRPRSVVGNEQPVDPCAFPPRRRVAYFSCCERLSSTRNAPGTSLTITWSVSVARRSYSRAPRRRLSITASMRSLVGPPLSREFLSTRSFSTSQDTAGTIGRQPLTRARF